MQSYFVALSELDLSQLKLSCVLEFLVIECNLCLLGYIVSAYSIVTINSLLCTLVKWRCRLLFFDLSHIHHTDLTYHFQFLSFGHSGAQP